MEDNQKPPTQSVGVEGFKADLYASDIKNIDWHILIHLPKFQMYAVEQTKLPSENVIEWIEGFVHEMVRAHGDETAFSMYVAWHDVKGYWKNETVYGELI